MRVIPALLSLLILAGCDLEPPSSNLGKLYVVQPGENLFSIAEREFGNGLLWPEIRRANPWVLPYQLEAGETLYIPTLDSAWAATARDKAGAMNPRPSPPESGANGRGRGGFANPPAFGPWRNVISDVSSKTLFGMPLPQSAFFAFCGLLSHSFVQSVLVWLATIFTFVKETSFKKSVKAVLLTETLTFATIVTLGAMAVVMLYLGSPPEELSRSRELLPALEDYLSTNAGVGVAAMSLLVVYAVLSMRFFPQVLGVKVGQAVPVMTLAVLIPHLLGMYLVGQRMGFLPV